MRNFFEKSKMEEQTQQVNVKVPKFMETAMNGWFTMLEAQFHLRNVTASKNKFYTVVLSNSGLVWLSEFYFDISKLEIHLYQTLS